MVSQYTLKLIDKKILEEKLKEINDIVEENNNKEQKNKQVIYYNRKNG